MSTTSSASTPAPLAPTILFARGVIARLATWPALKLAVQNSWGGPESTQKRTWLASVVVDAFTEESDTPDVEYVEEMLAQVMSDEFETVVEDGSAREVAVDVVRLWAETLRGASSGTEMVTEWERKADRMKSIKVQAEEEVGDESDWEESDEDGSDGASEQEEPPKLLEREGPLIDEDGFTLVKGKGKK